MRKVLLLVALAALAIVGGAIGSSTAGAASSGASASAASASGGDQATAARRRGRRGPRGRRGARGAKGDTGAQGPQGTPGTPGSGGGGGVGGVKLFYRSGVQAAEINIGVFAPGFLMSASCPNAVAGPIMINAQSTANDGFWGQSSVTGYVTAHPNRWFTFANGFDTTAIVIVNDGSGQGAGPGGGAAAAQSYADPGITDFGFMGATNQTVSGEIVYDHGTNSNDLATCIAAGSAQSYS